MIGDVRFTEAMREEPKMHIIQANGPKTDGRYYMS